MLPAGRAWYVPGVPRMPCNMTRKTMDCCRVQLEGSWKSCVSFKSNRFSSPLAPCLPLSSSPPSGNFHALKLPWLLPRVSCFCPCRMAQRVGMVKESCLLPHHRLNGTMREKSAPCCSRMSRRFFCGNRPMSRPAAGERAISSGSRKFHFPMLSDCISPEH